MSTARLALSREARRSRRGRGRPLAPPATPSLLAALQRAAREPDRAQRVVARAAALAAADHTPAGDVVALVAVAGERCIAGVAVIAVGAGAAVADLAASATA